MATPPPEGTTTTRKWKCGCGALEVELRNEPVQVFNCHCHSCVAVGRYVGALDTEHKNGTSDIDPTSGGSAKVFFRIKDISSPEELSRLEGKLGYTKVGPDGKMVRSYSKCCGTPFVTGASNAPLNGRPINRFAIYNEDGSRFSDSMAKAPPNIMLRYAFGDPESVPDPKSQLVDLAGLVPFLKMLGGYFVRVGMGTDWKDKDKILFCDCKDAEVVPITWE